MILPGLGQHDRAQVENKAGLRLGAGARGDYGPAMPARLASPLTWIRLLITLLALTGMMGRAVAPMPAASPGSALRLIGAVLCHDGPSSPAPIHAPPCDHCPFCVSFLQIAAVLPDARGSGRARVVLAEARRTPFRIAGLNPRAPPDRAHPPRAPPLG